MYPGEITPQQIILTIFGFIQYVFLTFEIMAISHDHYRVIVFTCVIRSVQLICGICAIIAYAEFDVTIVEVWNKWNPEKDDADDTTLTPNSSTVAAAAAVSAAISEATGAATEVNKEQDPKSIL